MIGDEADGMEAPGLPEIPSTNSVHKVSQSFFPQSSNPFAAPSFDPTDWINETFQTEHSLSSLDACTEQLKQRIAEYDREVVDAMQAQGISSNKATDTIEDTKGAISELIDRVGMIKSKAEKSEQMVHNVYEDIKYLDTGKRNIVSAVTSLRRLHMMVSAVEQLHGLAMSRGYADAANLLEAINQLQTHFDAFKEVPKVNSLRHSIQKINQTFRDRVMEDFKEYDPTLRVEEARVKKSTLADACMVVEALGPETRDALLKWFVGEQLKAYKAIFEPPGEASSLDQTERRFAWLKRKIREYEDHYAQAFPPHWNALKSVCEEFCVITRKHLVQVLGGMQAENLIKVDVLMRVLQSTKECEMELSKRFCVPRRNLKREASEEDRFLSRMSGCFEPYMGAYVNLEDRNLGEFVSSLLPKDAVPAEIGDHGAKILNSSQQIFLHIKRAVKRCSALTTQQTMFNLLEVFQKHLRSYCDSLKGKLPRVSSTTSGFGGVSSVASTFKERPASKLSDENKSLICYVVNTAEYCAETTDQLGALFARTIDASLAESVDVSGPKEEFENLVSDGIFVYVGAVLQGTEAAFAEMSRIDWLAHPAVGDQSAFVTELETEVLSSAKLAGQLLTATHYRFFVDKLVAAFIPRYLSRLYQCRSISETGAQQLLLDTNVIKTVLLKLPSLGPPGGPSVDSYARLVNEEVKKCEILLKLVLTPPESLLITYKALVSDASTMNLRRIMDLKGLTKREQQEILGDGPGLGTSTAAAPSGVFGQGTATPAAASGARAYADATTGLTQGADVLHAGSDQPGAFPAYRRASLPGSSVEGGTTMSVAAQQAKEDLKQAAQHASQNIRRFFADKSSRFLKGDNTG
eukprot:Rmarinus@m.2352